MLEGKGVGVSVHCTARMVHGRLSRSSHNPNHRLPRRPLTWEAPTSPLKSHIYWKYRLIILKYRFWKNQSEHLEFSPLLSFLCQFYHLSDCQSTRKGEGLMPAWSILARCCLGRLGGRTTLKAFTWLPVGSGWELGMPPHTYSRMEPGRRQKTAIWRMDSLVFPLWPSPFGPE